MSAKAVAWARSVQLGPGRTLGVVRRCVLIVIADYYRDDVGCAWPSLAALADSCDVAEASVSRAVVELEAAGLVEIERHPRRVSRYRPTWAAPHGLRVRRESTQGTQGVDPGYAGSRPRVRRESTQGTQAEGLILQEILQENPQGSHAGAREGADLPPAQRGEPAEEQEAEENSIPSTPGPSRTQEPGPPTEEAPSISAARISESASPVVSDVERAVAHFASVAPLTLRRALRGPSPARGDVEAAVAAHGADRVIAAVDEARRARADGCPPWAWVQERLEGRAKPAGGRRGGYDPEKDPRVVGWTRGRANG